MSTEGERIVFHIFIFFLFAVPIWVYFRYVWGFRFSSLFLCERSKESVPQLVPPVQMYRPSSFDEYIGQKRNKEIAKAYIEQTRQRSIVFPHTLIYGKAGGGKTTFARILAKELNCGIVEVMTSNVSNDLLYTYVASAGGGILFMDEIHSLSREITEKLYTAMEDFQIDGRPIAPFTLVGATTEVGEIIKTRRPFYDRFKLKLELEDYTINELVLILKQYKEHLFAEDTLPDNTVVIIAKNCRLTPRIGISLLENTIYFNGDIKKTLSFNKIIEDGYTIKDLRVLEYVSQNEKGVGLQGLAAYLGCSENNYLYDVEPFLLKNGLILRAARGRKITETGKQLIMKLKGALVNEC